ncbi:acyl-CoA dehydrogenase family protein [Xenophilus arseniciresistens]|uniref:Medium-chain specific acyl-CoA dehydrogenase, mitochondrial n=1 Tax=Xenophilus arseniciresistens TaxID=1283306 RepID=A0AAE3ND57_9BURK|nr:acyl-CoA dehydrogenase family protein [Xenophilus arseniciresistens]MDA7419053.1 acyl-CoA dehydrogenase family protein [Xenophilus arseniciresistens]
MDAKTVPNAAASAPLFSGPFEGSERAAALIERVQDFLHGELAELARTHQVGHEEGASREVLQQVWKRSHALGFYGMTLPEKMGGLGLSVLDHALIKEAIYTTGSVFAPHVFGELSGPPRVGALARFATPWQMQKFIVPVAQAEKAICFALTEEQAGSDAGAVQTHAVQQGDEFVINGRKRFISGAPFADFAVMVCSTAAAPGPDPKQREVSAFFVDLKAPGVRVESGYKTMAGQSGTGNIVFENARVPVASLIGERGRGLGLALGRITVNRLLHCPAMLGLAQVALRDARDYAQSRQQFGRAIGQFQAVQHMLADMATELAAARALMIHTARQLDAGAEGRAESSMAKLFCSETAFRIADRAVQIHGGEGIVQGRRVEFLFRLLRMYRVLTGTSEIQRNTIAKELLA